MVPYQVGQFVAMCCHKYKEYKPQIAKLRKINASSGTVQIDWLDGNYERGWKIWKIRGRIIKYTVPILAILAQVQFCTDMHISEELKCELDEKYSSAEFV